MSINKAWPIFFFVVNGLFCMDVKIIAHRGFSSKAPENTISAFAMAVEQPIDFVECDVHLTKDRKLVISHDPCIKKTEILILEKNYEAILDYEVGGWFSKKYEGEKIPLLEDLLLMDLKGKGVMIEVKENDTVLDSLIEELVSLLSEKRFALKNFCLGSLSTKIMEELKVKGKKFPLIGIAESVNELTYFPERVALNYKNLTKKQIDDLHARGVEVWSWTIDDIKIAKKLVKQGLDGIITNYPDKIRKALYGE